MNTLHLRTFLWLRWRLFVNQMRRGGIANSIILGILSVSAVLGAVGSFVGAVAAGVFLLPMASPTVQLLIWDGADRHVSVHLDDRAFERAPAQRGADAREISASAGVARRRFRAQLFELVHESDALVRHSHSVRPGIRQHLWQRSRDARATPARGRFSSP